MSGSVSIGWLDTTTTSVIAGSERNPFTSVSFDYRDAIIDPAFISYRVQPTVGVGFQDLFGTASPRSGGAAELSFLPARPFPLRVYYSRYHRSTVAASARYYARVLTENDDSHVGLQWQLRVASLPTLDLSASDSNVTTTPQEVLAVGYATHTRNLALNGTDTRWGWSFDGNVQFQRLDSERLGASGAGAIPVDTSTDLRLLRFGARRDLERVTIFLGATGTHADTAVSNGFLRQRFETYSARLRFQPDSRFTTWTEGRLTRSNLEARSANVSGGPGFVVPRTETSSQDVTWDATYEMLRGLRLLGRVEFTNVNLSSTIEPPQPASFLNTVGGVQFQRERGWAGVSGSYTLNRYVRQTDDVSRNDLLGHALDVTASVGKASAVRASVGYAISRSRQEVRVALPYINDSRRVRVALEKEFLHGSRLEVHWDVTDSTYDAALVRSAFSGRGYGAALRLPRLGISFDHGYGAGDAVQQVLDRSLTPLSGAPSLVVAGSDSEYTNAMADWWMTSSLSLRAVWRDQRQAIGALETARVEQREAGVRYDFRRLHVEGGYVFYRFDFGSPIFRKSLLFRVVRDFQLF